MNYSYNLDKKAVIFASARDLNASFKDLCAVCDAVRYRPVPSALKVLDGIINEGRPIEYKRHNKYMGSRHELGGKKGRYPLKCADMVRKVIVNASANAKNKGENPESMYVVHASANKTYEVPRSPPKGVRAVGGNYGYTTMRTANLSFAKIEIGIADKDSEDLGARMKRAVKAVSKNEKATTPSTKIVAKPTRAKQPATTKPLPAPKAAVKEAKQESAVPQAKQDETQKV